MEAPRSKNALPKSESSKTDVKTDPDSRLTTINTIITSNVRVKDEEEYPKLDRTLPAAAGEEDIFEDVDGEETEHVDLTYEGIAHVNGVRHFVCEGFKIRQIPEPYIVKRKLLDLHRCIAAGSIVLDPEYQREVVWDEGRAALLITSILMGFFIPPIIFNVKKSVVKKEGREEEKYTRICVDGKQRLTSIYKFMNGQIGFFDTGIPQRKWYWSHLVINGQVQIANRNILPKAVKEFFERQFFCCYEYEELDLDTEETMFQLVQRGIALTPAEKMRAMSTDWAAFTKQYEEDYSLVTNLSKQNRASGFRLILTIFTMIQEVMSSRRRRHPLSSLKTPSLQASPQALQRVLDDKSPINPALKLRFKSIFDRYETLIKLSSTRITATKYKVKPNSAFDPAPSYLTDGDGSTGHVRTFSPLELIVTAILVAVWMDKRGDREFLEDVKEMRKWLRRGHRDLRVNAQCWGTAWSFISREMEKRVAPSADVGVDGVDAELEGRERSSSPLSEARSDMDENERVSSRSSSPVPEPRARKTRSMVGKRRLARNNTGKQSKGKGVVGGKGGKVSKVKSKKGRGAALKGASSKAKKGKQLA